MKKITAKELDRKFDAGEDITEYLDFSKVRRPGQENKLNKNQPQKDNKKEHKK